MHAVWTYRPAKQHPGKQRLVATCWTRRPGRLYLSVMTGLWPVLETRMKSSGNPGVGPKKRGLGLIMRTPTSR